MSSFKFCMHSSIPHFPASPKPDESNRYKTVAMSKCTLGDMNRSGRRLRWPKGGQSSRERILRRTGEAYDSFYEKTPPGTKRRIHARMTERSELRTRSPHRPERTSHEANPSDGNRAPCERACARRHGIAPNRKNQKKHLRRPSKRAHRPKYARHRNPGPARGVGIPCGSGKSVVFLRARRSNVSEAVDLGRIARDCRIEPADRIKKPSEQAYHHSEGFGIHGGGAENRTPVHTTQSLRLYKLIPRSGFESLRLADTRRRF